MDRQPPGDDPATRGISKDGADSVQGRLWFVARWRKSVLDDCRILIKPVGIVLEWVLGWDWSG